MVRFSLFKFLLSPALGASLALTVAVTPARADDPTTNFGPFGPNEPILAAMDGQRVIAFFVPERGSCAVNAIIWKDLGADAPYASSRVRTSLRPGEMVKFDHGPRGAMNLLCGADASTLTVVAPAELILTNAPNSGQ
jgi:hypothetical protein